MSKTYLFIMVMLIITILAVASFGLEVYQYPDRKIELKFKQDESTGIEYPQN